MGYRASMALIHEALTREIVATYFEIYNVVGCGFLESVYAGAFCTELSLRGIPHSRERRYPVHYKGTRIADFRADLVVADTVIVELKAVSTITPAHEAQLLNYLRASRLQVGFVFNFTHKPEMRRLVWTGRTGSLDAGPPAGLTPTSP